MSWVDIEDAVHKVMVRASGLDADKIVWAYQNVNQPSGSHVILNFGGGRAIGVDRISQQQDLTRSSGQEIGQLVRGVREVPLDVDCYSADTSGESAARHLAERIRSNLRLESNIFILRKVQLSMFDTSGAINWVPDIPSVRFRGRANFMVRCYVPTPTIAEEFVGYIARIRGTFYPVGWQGNASGASGITFDSDDGA